MDYSKSKKRVAFVEKISKILLYLIFIMLGFSASAYFSMRDIMDKSNLKTLFLTAIFIIIGIYLHLIIHEFGHFICGKLTSYKFVSFRVGSITLVKKDGKYRFKRYRLPGTGGQCLMSPPDLNQKGNFPVFLYNLGGVLANIFFALIFKYLYEKTNLGGEYNIIFGIFYIIGLFTALINLLPLRADGIPNDGYNILLMMKDKNARKGLWLQLRLNEKMIKSVRLKDVDRNWFNTPGGANLDNPLINTMLVNQVGHYMDRHNFKSARKSINNIIDKNIELIKIHQYELLSSLIFIELIEGNIDEAKKLMNEDMEKYINKMKKYFPSKLSLSYAYELVVNKDKLKASEELDKFKDLEKSYIYPGEVESERELIELIKNKYNN